MEWQVKQAVACQAKESVTGKDCDSACNYVGTNYN